MTAELQEQAKPKGDVCITEGGCSLFDSFVSSGGLKYSKRPLTGFISYLSYSWLFSWKKTSSKNFGLQRSTADIKDTPAGSRSRPQKVKMLKPCIRPSVHLPVHPGDPEIPFGDTGSFLTCSGFRQDPNADTEWCAAPVWAALISVFKKQDYKDGGLQKQNQWVQSSPQAKFKQKSTDLQRWKT